MKVAVVDIGSNAIRSTFYGIDQIHGDEILMKKLSYLRLPIRLGEDVFKDGKISLAKVSNVLSMSHAFKHLCMIHEVTDYRLVATSAMREADNGGALIELVKSQVEVEIELISGDEEAEMIFESIFLCEQVDTTGSYMTIDVGGGSTEITFLNHGERCEAKSFRLGSVRCQNSVDQDEWTKFQQWIKKYAKKYQPSRAIGTGGNINKMHRLCGVRNNKVLSLKDFEEKVEYLKQFTYKELVEEEKLKTDRADVIIPASNIYLEAMRQAGVDEIIVPKVGLAEGVARKLFRHHLEKS
ncbi:putative phosphatase [Lentisphaera araneosa HTCC2155]|uniref:Putative phosphatase n=1 Tax=Lentisphaera araneosa HTCC2155 TaxID=313628 RepID=A6DTN1_9BACT|nr:phosphatase [Lentisphaera araneosa]EDM25011.1 putative phosphatase [Lentisphaera araneosa HTCC2155]